MRHRLRNDDDEVARLRARVEELEARLGETPPAPPAAELARSTARLEQLLYVRERLLAELRGTLGAYSHLLARIEQGGLDELATIDQLLDAPEDARDEPEAAAG